MADEGWRDAVHRDLAAGKQRKGKPRPYDTREWKQRRAELKDGAGCVLCARFGVYEVATVADHIIPTADSGEDFYDARLQPLCAPCHVIKRKIEGQWRKGTLGITELNVATGKEAGRLRASAFGVGVDGLALVPWK